MNLPVPPGARTWAGTNYMAIHKAVLSLEFRDFPESIEHFLKIPSTDVTAD